MEIRKRLYRDGLGDKLDWTSLLVPSNSATMVTSSASSNIENVDTRDTERKDANTQEVQEFYNSIKKCRDSLPFHRNTQPLSKSSVIDLSSDTEEELTDGEIFFFIHSIDSSLRLL